MLQECREQCGPIHQYLSSLLLLFSIILCPAVIVVKFLDIKYPVMYILFFSNWGRCRCSFNSRVLMWNYNFSANTISNLMHSWKHFMSNWEVQLNLCSRTIGGLFAVLAQLKSLKQPCVWPLRFLWSWWVWLGSEVPAAPHHLHWRGWHHSSSQRNHTQTGGILFVCLYLPVSNIGREP